MAPRLIAISGSLKGITFELTAKEVSFGREASNTIHLNDPSVSRRHCVIRSEVFQEAPEGEDSNHGGNDDADSNRRAAFTIVDLDSYNGTFVNGTPVKNRQLKHGDQIALGDVLLLFLLHETEAGATPPTFSESELITRSTVRLRREDALYLRPERIVAELPPSDRVSRDLAALLQISSSIGAITNLEKLQDFAIDSISKAIPAERAVVLLTNDLGEPESISGWTKLTGRDNSIKPSRSITQQVLHEGVALLSNDLLDNKALNGRTSLAEANICSVLCVPMVVFDETLGTIYLDTIDSSARFDENHLQLLTAIAGIAAIAFQNASHLQSLANDNQRLRQEINLEHQLIGESEALRKILQFLAKVAPTDSTVLLRGESGTGKELAARAIHVNSNRAQKPFVAINCATLTETLIESELFGHEKGAFTGAVALKRGKLEIAHGGTVFLDEVAELTPLIQAKLLRVLQEREFERLGGTQPIKVDVRIITATNQDLEERIKDKRFRQDLYYRLNVVSVSMPALRQRREDIPLLANYFVSLFSKRCKRRVLGISKEARSLLQSYEWPGNVRELENAIERAVVMGSSESILTDDLPERLLESESQGETNQLAYYSQIAESKKRIILKSIEQANGNYTRAAKALGIHPNNLHRLVRSLDLKPLSK